MSLDYFPMINNKKRIFVWSCIAFQMIVKNNLIVSNGDLNFYTWLDGDRSDLLDDLRRRVQVNDAFVNAQLEQSEEQWSGVFPVHKY